MRQSRATRFVGRMQCMGGAGGTRGRYKRRAARRAHPDFSTAALSDRPERVSISLYRVRRETRAVSDGDGAEPFEVRECLRKPLNRGSRHGRPGRGWVEASHRNFLLGHEEFFSWDRTQRYRTIPVLRQSWTQASNKQARKQASLGKQANKQASLGKQARTQLSKQASTKSMVH